MLKDDYKTVRYILEHIEPKMLIRDMASGTFVLVPFKYLNELCYNHDANTWQYAFVNVAKKTYRMTFCNFGEFIDAVVQSDEIWYGSEKFRNPLFCGSREALNIKIDMEVK